MKLLLDTHIWLWTTLDSERLSRYVNKALADPTNELWLSWVGKTVQDLQLSEAPLTVEVALAISSIHVPHGDPTDHFLAATAKTFDLTLVTADEQLINLPGIHVLPNR